MDDYNTVRVNINEIALIEYYQWTAVVAEYKTETTGIWPFRKTKEILICPAKTAVGSKVILNNKICLYVLQRPLDILEMIKDE